MYSDYLRLLDRLFGFFFINFTFLSLRKNLIVVSKFAVNGGCYLKHESADFTTTAVLETIQRFGRLQLLPLASVLIYLLNILT